MYHTKLPQRINMTNQKSPPDKCIKKLPQRVIMTRQKTTPEMCTKTFSVVCNQDLEAAGKNCTLFSGHNNHLKALQVVLTQHMQWLFIKYCSILKEVFILTLI